MHLDCLPDRAPGPSPSPVLSEVPRGLGCTVPILEVLVEGDSWGAGRLGNFTVFLFPKLCEARAPLKHLLYHSGHIYVKSSPSLYHQSDLDGRILERRI